MAPPRNRRSQRPADDDEYSIHVPFLDADPSAGEVPLAELDEFIVPGSDSKGRKITISFNIPPMLDRQLDVILSSKRFPYVNKKDLLRHAAARHCMWLLGIRLSVPRHVMSMLNADLEVCRDDEYGMRSEQVFLTIHDRVNDHVQKGEHGEALRLVSVINQNLRELKPSVWVTRFAERFFSRYGQWLRTTAKANGKNAGAGSGSGEELPIASD